jgi:hypothetical protein
VCHTPRHATPRRAAQHGVRAESSHRFHKDETDWGFTQYMPLVDALDPAKGFLLNDTLKVKVEVQVQVRSRQHLLCVAYVVCCVVQCICGWVWCGVVWCGVVCVELCGTLRVQVQVLLRLHAAATRGRQCVWCCGVACRSRRVEWQVPCLGAAAG